MIVVCSACRRERSHHAGGLCQVCYNKAKRFTLPSIVCVECGKKRRLHVQGVCRGCHRKELRRIVLRVSSEEIDELHAYAKRDRLPFADAVRTVITWGLEAASHV